MRAFAISVLIVIAATSHAIADPKEGARVHVNAADTHFKLGRFTDALEAYTKAYELYPAPPLLFNLGQCHRNLKNWERAVFFFRGYLRERPDATNRQVVEDLILEAQREIEAAKVGEQAKLADERRKAEQARLKLEADRKRILEQQATTTPAPITIQQPERERPTAAPPIYKRWWFWSVIGGTAVAAAGTAYYFSGGTTVVEPTGTLGGLDRQ